MTIPATLTLQRLKSVNDATINVLRQTIISEAQDGLDKATQRVTGVLFDKSCITIKRTTRREGGEQAMVMYELLLEELCGESCRDQVKETTMYDTVTSHMLEQIASGGFTRTLRAFAKECTGKDCGGIRGASVEEGTFGDEEIEVLVSFHCLGTWLFGEHVTSVGCSRTPSVSSVLDTLSNGRCNTRSDNRGEFSSPLVLLQILSLRQIDIFLVYLALTGSTLPNIALILKHLLIFLRGHLSLRQ